MKITVGQIYQGLGVLRNFGNQKFPNPAITFRLGRLIDILNTEYNRANDLRNELLDEYAERVEGTDLVTYSFKNTPRERAKEHDRKWAELCAVEVDIQITPINLDDVPQELLPTANEMAHIIWIFVDPETTGKASAANV